VLGREIIDPARVDLGEAHRARAVDDRVGQLCRVAGSAVEENEQFGHGRNVVRGCA
jgi:hypothetical protein